MKQIESITKTPALLGEIAAAEGELSLVGAVPLNVLGTLFEYDYKVLDLSQAIFGQEEETYQIILGYQCNYVPVYGGTGVRVVDVLKRLLENVKASLVILPDDVARRHMNAIVRNEKIRAACVSENCKLFAMVGEDVYNKKKSSLVFSKRNNL